MLLSGRQKKRIVGFVLLTVLLSVFLVFNRFPKLDIVREDLRAASSLGECFQGFCVDTGATLFSRWWEFSVTYLELVAPGMIFAFLVAGLTGAFLFPSSGTRMFSSGGLWGSFKGLIVGTPMSLCSACIVPISRALRGKGASIATTLAIVQGSATLNAPALIMVALIFNPLLGGSRILLSILAGLLIGPLVAWVVGERKERDPEGLAVTPFEGKPDSWKDVLVNGGIEWIRASLGYLLRLGPVMILAGFISGLAIQWVRPEVVETYLGNNLQGVALAATLGILINVPLLFEVPLVVLLLLLGMGAAPAAPLLFTAAAGGPITFWGLARSLPRRGIVTFAAATWLVGMLGGLSVFALGPFVPDTALGYRSSADITVHPESQKEVVRTGADNVSLWSFPPQAYGSQKSNATLRDISLDLTGMQPLSNGYQYEVWLVFGSKVRSVGKFQSDTSGQVIPTEGFLLHGQSLALPVDSTHITEILITIEPPGEDDGRPSETRYLAGTIVNGGADLTVSHPLALGVSFRRAKAFYILSSPSSTGLEDWKSGIWWLDLMGDSTLAGEPGLHLPELPAGWLYEGWVEVSGQALTTGRFHQVFGHDFDSPYNGPLPVPAVPGEDYILNAPEGLAFPTDIRGGRIFVSVEPYPDDDPKPFSISPLLSTIPKQGGYRITYRLENVYRQLPSGVVRVITWTTPSYR